MKIIDKLRLCQVKRYPICHTNRDQNVAEHSYNVAIIAVELAKNHSDPQVAYEVAMYALEHDLEEVFTGDIPSSFKRQLRQQCPEVSGLLGAKCFAGDDVQNIVKIADFIEAMWFLAEFGGSRLAVGVKNDIEHNFKNFLALSPVSQPVRSAAEHLWGELCKT